ncbi:hypothetical protein [Deinococcus sp. NW-56]|uniref:hypothetical protein n=1 Tax=Deinococcus sp. NW-56 TaxID=2080419 RepID=UPI000CF3D95F|nr:hypothetical protein [Deinococcus sp. NW-56]
MTGGVYRQVEVLRLERDPHADMHAPEQPYRLTLWDPETNVHDPEQPHGCRNLSGEEVRALVVTGQRLLNEAPQTAAALDVLRERHRQITEEERSPLADDGLTENELVRAAVAYATEGVVFAHFPLLTWPWDAAGFKPTDKRRNLVKAAALLMAEIERLDRAAGGAR